MKRHLFLLPLLLLASLPSPAEEPAKSTPCRCTTVRKSVTPLEVTLQYFPEQNNGQGCVVSGKTLPAPRAPMGIAASYQPAGFVLQFKNRSGAVLRGAGGESRVGKLAIYLHVKRDEKLYEELQGTLSSTGTVPTKPHDVADGGTIQSVHFVWPEGFNAPDGEYVARLSDPHKVEVRFTLADNRRGKPVTKKP